MATRRPLVNDGGVIKELPAGDTLTSNLAGCTGLPQSGLAAGVAGNGPAFSAYQSTGQAISASVGTKISFQTESYDTANCYDNAVNYRFTPNVAGYYAVDCAVAFGAYSIAYVSLYKNGIAASNFGVTVSSGMANVQSMSIIYLNGSTDYIEMYVYLSPGQTLYPGAVNTNFRAFLIRSN